MMLVSGTSNVGSLEMRVSQLAGAICTPACPSLRAGSHLGAHERVAKERIQKRSDPSGGVW